MHGLIESQPIYGEIVCFVKCIADIRKTSILFNFRKDLAYRVCCSINNHLKYNSYNESNYFGLKSHKLVPDPTQKHS